jgi:hypothetical protein
MDKMETNHVAEFAGKYAALMTKVGQGDYSNSGPVYHLLLDSYNELMTSIDKNELKSIKTKKHKLLKEIDSIQESIKKAWDEFFPNIDYPHQNTIHGVNIVIELLLAEAEKL